MAIQLLMIMHYDLASVILEFYYPHCYQRAQFTTASPAFSPVLQRAATTELSDAGIPLISYLRSSQYKKDTLMFLSVSLKAGNKSPT